jgi:hypothetical protein
VTAAKIRVSRNTRRRLATVTTDFAKLGKARHRSLKALRDSGPIAVLDWINEDFILRETFDGLLEQLGQERSLIVRSGIGARIRPVVSEHRRTITVIDLHAQLSAQFRLIEAPESLREYSRHILDRLATAPAAWLARVRRCAYIPCKTRYFWDPTAAATKKHCSGAHKKAAGRDFRKTDGLSRLAVRKRRANSHPRWSYPA